MFEPSGGAAVWDPTYNQASRGVGIDAEFVGAVAAPALLQAEQTASLL